MQQNLASMGARTRHGRSQWLPPVLEVAGGFTPIQLLEVLNHGSGGFVERYAKRERLLEQLSDEILGVLVSASVMVTTLLRSYVAAWIDTGREPTGSENPLRRSLKAAPEAFAASAAFQARYPINVEIFDLGESQQSMKYDVGCRSLLEGKRELSSNPTEAARAWAQSFFVALLLSPWRYRICQCRRCQTFFMLPRAPLGRGYVHGISCESCSAAAHAVASTKKRRQNTREVFTELAAEACSRLDFSVDDIRLFPEDIAQAVTASLKKINGHIYRGKRIDKKPCSAKWVSTYAPQIALAQEKLKHKKTAKAAVRRKG